MRTALILALIGMALAAFSVSALLVTKTLIKCDELWQRRKIGRRPPTWISHPPKALK